MKIQISIIYVIRVVLNLKLKESREIKHLKNKPHVPRVKNRALGLGYHGDKELDIWDSKENFNKFDNFA
jgi:hypothetical protein